MPLVLDATVGGATSNSYLTLGEADAYFLTRLYSTAWTNASGTPFRETALAWATRLLDRSLDWNGALSSLTQALRWPRTGATTIDGQLYAADVIPPELKEATAELAIYLLRKDRTTDPLTAGIKSFKVGTLDFEFDKTTIAPVIPDAVYQLIRHLGTLSSVGQNFSGISVATLIRT